MGSDLAALEAQIGHHFQDRGLLERALTHKSYRFERPAAAENGVLGDNEQLEFLGDSVLGFLVSEQLVLLYPDLPEGGLSKRKAHLVSAQRLFETAEKLNLGRHLLLGRGEEMSGGRSKRALLANAVEAVIAALYLDGGVEAARRFILEHLIGKSAALAGSEGGAGDYKSALQELTQRLKLPPPRYSIVREQGPEHSKTFTVEVRVGRGVAGRGDGLSKKSAGQMAARLALEQLQRVEKEAAENGS